MVLIYTLKIMETHLSLHFQLILVGTKFKKYRINKKAT